MAQDYDKIIKENLEAAFMAIADKFLGINIKKHETLNVELQSTLSGVTEYGQLITRKYY